MIGVSCKKELITERYEDLIRKMSSDAHFCIFNISNWADPWCFGRENKGVANKIYKEALEATGWDASNISDDINAGYIIIALKSQNEIGIVYITEDDNICHEYLEDLLNYMKVSKEYTVQEIPKQRIPEPKKPDNLVINKLNLFK